MQSRRLAIRPFSPARVGSVYYAVFWPLVACYGPFINVYFQELGLSGTQLGILAAIFPFFAITVSPSLSSLADRRGQRLRMLRLALIGWALVLLVYPFVTAFWPIFLLVVLESSVRSPAIPIGDSVIAQTAVRHRLRYGQMRLWGSLGFAIVSILAGVVWQRVGYRPMFWAAAAIAILPLLVVGLLEEGTAVPSKSRRSMRTLFQDRGIQILIFTAFLIGIAMFATFIFDGVYVVQLGGNETHVGLLFGLSALAEVPVMRASGQIIDRLQGERTLLLAMAVTLLAMVIHAIAWSPIVLIFASVLKGVGYGLFFVVMVQLLDERAPTGWSSTAQSLFQAAFLGLAPLLTSTLSGVIYDAWGPAALFAGLTAVVAVSMGLLLAAMARGWFAPHEWASSE